MFKWFTRIVIFGTVVGLTTAMLFTAYWNRLGKFKQPKLPMTYYVSPSQPEEGIAAAIRGAELWNEAVEKEVIVIKLKYVVNNGNNNIYFSNNQKIDMGQNRLGTTVIQGSFDWGVMGEVDIYIPDFIRTFSLKEVCYNRGEVDKYYLLSVVVHEMGHGLGLPHYNFRGSIMEAYMDKTYFDMIVSGKDLEFFATPTTFDANKLKEKYPEYFNVKDTRK